MKSIIFVFLFFANLFSVHASANTFDEQIRLLDEITPYVERVDLARLLLVRKSVEAIKKDMETNLQQNKSEITFQNLRLIQNLIVQYRFSQVFFGWTTPRSITSIYTRASEEALTSLKGNSDLMITTYGFDDSPYTQITANTFRQMHKLLQQLETLPIQDDFKNALRTLWMPIGETIAIAEQGDRPKTFVKATPLIQQIRTMYPQFDAVAATSAGFPLIMELQGLAEFYAEFAQVGDSL